MTNTENVPTYPTENVTTENVTNEFPERVSLYQIALGYSHLETTLAPYTVWDVNTKTKIHDCANLGTAKEIAARTVKADKFARVTVFDNGYGRFVYHPSLGSWVVYHELVNS